MLSEGRVPVVGVRLFWWGYVVVRVARSLSEPVLVSRDARPRRRCGKFQASVGLLGPSANRADGAPPSGPRQRRHKVRHNCSAVQSVGNPMVSIVNVGVAGKSSMRSMRRPGQPEFLSIARRR